MEVKYCCSTCGKEFGSDIACLNHEEKYHIPVLPAGIHLFDELGEPFLYEKVSDIEWDSISYFICDTYEDYEALLEFFEQYQGYGTEILSFNPGDVMEYYSDNSYHNLTKETRENQLFIEKLKEEVKNG